MTLISVTANHFLSFGFSTIKVEIVKNNPVRQKNLSPKYIYREVPNLARLWSKFGEGVFSNSEKIYF